MPWLSRLTSSARSGRRWGRLALALVLALVALELVYLAAANVFLSTPLAGRVLNRKPEKLLLEYDSAWSPWPGEVRIRGFRIRGQGRAAQWIATADRLSGRIALLPLAWKSFRASGIEGEGVTFRLRRRRDRFPDLPFPPDQEPPIPGFENPPEPPPPPPPEGPRRRWSVALSGVELGAVREIWIDRFRLLDEAELAGGFTLRLKRSLRVHATRVELSEARVLVGDETIATGVRGGLRLSSERFDHTEHRGRRSLPFFAADLEAQGRGAGLGFLDAYLERLPWLRVAGGAGPFAADLHLDDGRLEPGSTLVLEPRETAIAFLDYRARGRGRVELRVDDDGARLAARLADYEIARRGHDAPHVRGSGLVVAVATPDARLPPSFEEARVAIRLPPAEIPNLAVYNAYLPEAAGLVIEGGRGTIEGRFEARAATGLGSGILRLAGRDVGVTYGGTGLRGDVELESRFPRAELEGRSFRLDGTRLTVTGGRLAGESEGEPWAARVLLPRGVLEPGRPVFLRTDVTAALSDAHPVVALYRERRPLPGWVLEALDLGELKATARVEAGRERVAIEDLEAEADPLRLAGRLVLAGPSRKTGRLLLTYRDLAIGLELRGGETDLKLLGAREWFREGE